MNLSQRIEKKRQAASKLRDAMRDFARECGLGHVADGSGYRAELEGLVDAAVMDFEDTYERWRS